ncbi:type II CRISPR RNA-guided endonuclease Cas9 [Cloacibacterium normanense]|uniref:type II CRISPR RNA-guided endonuclease Cas9 n=1 Tax=Cloacibacterium normanense TaxID=237258 RepID=UPI00391A3128
MKTILGLDLGTNSVGWALIKQDFDNKIGEILGMGSRIIPMDQKILGEFGSGNSVSQTAERTKYRSVRRLRERFLLRRERLHRVLNVLNFLPEHYSSQIDFEKRFGKFKSETEPKLAWKYFNGKFSFLFQTSFNEMLEDFKAAGKDFKIPYDWTIYYLRKKALSQKIEKEELAWLLLNFNQKRGYYQLRGEEEEENPNKLVEFHSLNIIDVIADEPQKGKSDVWYSLILENGWVYRRASKIPLFDWKDKIRDFIVTTDLNDDGSVKTDRDGKEKRSFRAPSETDWTLVKKKTEQGIKQSNKTVGAFIYDSILENPKQKINGKLVRTIERKFYKDELKQILEKQVQLQPELFTEDLYNDCIRELYRNNEAHQLTLKDKDFVHLLLEDIIFYQRPLRSQKSSVSNCTLEFRKFKDKNGVEHAQYLKVIPKSNPYFQEFRIWQWIFNLNIYSKEDDKNVTKDFLNTVEDFENLFEFLNHRKEVDQKSLLKHFKLNEKNHLWNFVEDKKYPCNETRAMISSRLEKVANVPVDFLNREIEQKIWHIIYSVNDKIEFEKALKSFALKNNLEENSFFEAFRKFPPFKSEYGSFSEKAIKKLLKLMRLGKYWDYNQISEQTKNRIQKIITGEYDENIKDKVREKAMHLTDESDFQGLPLWLAQYVVYDRHSEAAMLGKWNSVDDLEEFLKDFKQHSLRNPIVEQVITETLRVVKDIWQKYGNGAKDFFSEIHIELGREMKLPAAERDRMTRQMMENENTNLRIKSLLAELQNDSSVENVRPYSPVQQEILKIYEDGVLNSDIDVEDDILKISKTAQPSSADLKKYKLWLEQKYKSPYTGQIIPLSKLFTSEYEIEHIIPQSKYFDDSFNNKIICESAVNKLKDNYLGYSFIKNYGGTVVECGFGRKVTVFKVDEYEDFVKKHYAKNRNKRSNLLLEDIPEKMIERQLNDTRYISKYISGILSNIVREQDGTDEGVNSKNLVPLNGKITTELKKDWGLNDIWNDLILPRFERMNQLTNSSQFTAWSENHQKFLPTVPIEYSKGFSKKRIDHRHHALDALVIASATKDHVNLLNNQSAKSETKRYDLKKKLMRFEKMVYNHPKTGERVEREVPKLFLKPWETFTIDTKNILESIVVSFKQNLRVINKATNYYEKYVEKDCVKTKERVEQKGTNWAIRKPMHKETVSGKVDLPWIKVPKGKILTATRKNLDTSFDAKAINSITDTGIQKILLNYLNYKEGNPELAFSPEGIDDLNKNIERFNDGKPHQPISKVRVFELGSKFPLGQTGNKKDKYVEAAKGTNLFFAVYEDESGKRSYVTIPLNEVIERQKQGLSVVDLKGKNDFFLCPNDLVYIPSEDELANINSINFNNISNRNNIYKVVSFTGNRLYAIPFYVSSTIVNKVEFTQLNKIEFTKEKEICVKLKTDRLGVISKA